MPSAADLVPACRRLLEISHLTLESLGPDAGLSYPGYDSTREVRPRPKARPCSWPRCSELLNEYHGQLVAARLLALRRPGKHVRLPLREGERLLVFAVDGGGRTGPPHCRATPMPGAVVT